MRVLFFGSSDYCLPILETLNNNFKLVGIITRPDRPIGRKQTFTPSAPKQFALKNKIRCFTPDNITELLDLKDSFIKLAPDIAVVADYGFIIPKEIFEIPKYKTLNIHFSKLPQLRGPSPVQYTILTGEMSAWVTLIRMDTEMDTGDIFWQEEYLLTGQESTRILYERLFDEISKRLPEIITDYSIRKIKPKKQVHAKATFTKRLTREDGFIPWDIVKCALENKYPSQKLLSKWPLSKILHRQLTMNNFQLTIERACRALSPWPGMWTMVEIKPTPKISGKIPVSGKIPGIKGPKFRESRVSPVKKRLKILKAHIESAKDTSGVTGRLASPAGRQRLPRRWRNQETTLVIDLVQLEGKKPVKWGQFSDAYFSK